MGHKTAATTALSSAEHAALPFSVQDDETLALATALEFVARAASKPPS